MQPSHRIDASQFQDKLDKLTLTLVERLKDEWLQRLQSVPLAQNIFILSLRFCLYSYRFECEVFSDERREDYRWTWEKLVAIPPINRAVLDSLFNVVFMLEDIESRTMWYLRSGWSEQKQEYERFRREYANDPDWIEWLAEMRRVIERGATLFGVTEVEFTNPKKEIEPWPSTGQIPDYRVDSSKRPPHREFLRYLTDSLYKEHSGLAHMSFLGLMKLGPVLQFEDLPKSDRDELKKDALPRAMTSHVLRSAILLLCLCSELQNHFRFEGNLELRILEVWHTLLQGSPEAKDIFERRYKALFPATIIGS